MTLLLALLCVFIVYRFVRRPGGYIAYPTVLSVLYLAWVLPQIYALADNVRVPHEGWWSLMLMATLCLLAAAAGWALTFRRQPRVASGSASLQSRRIIYAAAILTFLSVAVNALLDSMRPSMAGVQQWTGPITIIAFFAQIRNVALAITLLLVLKRRTFATVFLAALNLATTLPIALVFLRRTEMITLITAVMGAYWFARRRSPNFALLAPVFLVVTVSVYSIGVLRSASNDIEMRTGERVSLLSPELWSRLDVGETVKTNAEGAHDFTNALYVIEYRQRDLDFEFGAGTWNGLVFQYVPAQIFGKRFKESLMIGVRGQVFTRISSMFNYDYQVGTTSTGFGSAFSDFWYFGATYFFVISAFLKRLFVRASAGDAWAQTLYLALLPPALIALTHGHDSFFTVLPFIYAVVMLIRWINKPGARAKAMAHQNAGRHAS